MLSPVSIVLVVEAVAVSLTSVFLLQPKFLFRRGAAQSRSGVRWVGMAFLCFTFCWSVIVGIVLTMNDVSFKI